MTRPTSGPARKPGRPRRGEVAARRVTLLEASLDAFLLSGFAGTSLDDIARAAHVAKRTIYEQFGDKEDLFAACIDQASRWLVGTFPPSKPAVNDLRKDLVTIGCAVLAFVLHWRSLSIYRLVVGESARQPNLARLFYQHGPARVIAGVASLLRQRLGPASTSRAASERYARDFVGLVVLEVQQRTVLGLAQPLSPAEIKAHVVRKVEMFLGGLPTGGDGAGT